MEKKRMRRTRATTLALLAMAAAIMSTETAETWKLCNMNRDGVTACRASISDSSAQKPAIDPSGACCAALSNADLNCLCSYKNSGLLPYFGIDPNLAMQLPGKCNIPAPAKC